jgi:hypothetical protein
MPSSRAAAHFLIPVREHETSSPSTTTTQPGGWTTVHALWAESPVRVPGQKTVPAGRIAGGRGVTAGTVNHLGGTMGRTTLASLVPARRLRISPASSSAMSRYPAKGKVDRTTRKATIDIAIINLTSGGPP